MAIVGGGILYADIPIVGKYGFAFPTFRWVGLLSLIYGIFVFIVSIRGFSADRKKRLAALARCKARRAQEAEAAKAEDNQHP